MSPDPQPTRSKIRLPVSAANGRLLKGYGPLVAMLVAFVLMATMVPTAHQLAGTGSSSGGLSAGNAQRAVRVMVSGIGVSREPLSFPSVLFHRWPVAEWHRPRLIRG